MSCDDGDTYAEFMTNESRYTHLNDHYLVVDRVVLSLMDPTYEDQRVLRLVLNLTRFDPINQ